MVRINKRKRHKGRENKWHVIFVQGMIKQAEALAANAAIGIAGTALIYQEEPAQDALLAGIQHLKQNKYLGVSIGIAKSLKEPVARLFF